MRYLLSVLLLVQSVSLFGQYHIKKVWLFSQLRSPGMVPRKQPGWQPAGPTTIYLCFIEVAKDERTADWQTASIKGNKYSVAMVPVQEDSVFVGTEKTTKALICLKPSAGNKLVKLELLLKDQTVGVGDTAAFLEGVAHKKRVVFKYDQPIVQLAPVLMP